MKISFILLLLSLFNSCASVRVVKKRPGKGGIIAVKEGLIGESADIKADRIMRENCRKGYRIVSEGEIVIGKKSSTRYGEKTKGNSKNGSSDTIEKNMREWRKKYKCRGRSARSRGSKR